MGLFPEQEPIAFADEAITIADAAIGPTLATIRPDGAPSANRAVFGPLETAQVRYRFMGDPTTAVGHLMDVGKVLEVVGYADISRIKFIRTGVDSGAFYVTYYR